MFCLRPDRRDLGRASLARKNAQICTNEGDLTPQEIAQRELGVISARAVLEDEEAALDRLPEDPCPNDSGDPSPCLVVEGDFLAGAEFLEAVCGAEP